MKFAFAILAAVAFTVSGSARVWPKWLPEHVTEIRFRSGVPGEQLRVVSNPSEIAKILQVFRRAQEVRKREAAVPSWKVCFDMLGERPEKGRWLLNLDTGDCTFLDPLGQPVYRLLEEDRQTLKKYFEPQEGEANQPPQPTPLTQRG